MINFALQKIDEIQGKLIFYKLTVDGNCEFDEFVNEIKHEGNLVSQLRKIQIRMQEIAEGKVLPKEKFKDITPKKEIVKENEIKTRDLRVYLFHRVNTGKVIVCGGKKSTQKSDIRHFRNLKKAYLK